MKFNLQCAKSVAECVALILGVLIAYSALGIAKDQIASSNASQKEATAQQAYGEYLKLAIEHPNLAAGLRELKDDEDKDASKASTKIQEEMYAWFVSYFLNSGEQIFMSTKGDKAWEQTLRLQVCNHQKFFTGPEWNDNLKDSFDKSYIALIESSIEWCGFKKSV